MRETASPELALCSTNTIRGADLITGGRGSSRLTPPSGGTRIYYTFRRTSLKCAIVAASEYQSGRFASGLVI